MKKPRNALSKRDEKARHEAAVAIARLGGLKGGKARAKSLSAEERRRIAVKAASARWGRTKGRPGKAPRARR